ncbi:MAG: sensor histidine kinase [Pseudonocardiaceae bacterium]
MRSVNQRWRWVVVFVVVPLAAALAVVQLHSWGLALEVAVTLGIAQTVPVAVVARWPVLSWSVAAGALTGSTFLGVGQGVLRWPWPAASCWVVLVVVVVVSATRRRRDAIAVGVVTAAVALVPALVTVPLPPGVVVLAVAAVAVAVGFGDSIRTRRQAQAALRTEAAQRAVLAERARIAREMHDIVAHRLSLIALQAEAAPHQLAELAHATFDTLRRMAGEGLTEMRRLLGVLRDDDTSACRQPAPRLADLPELIERARHSGATVHDRLDGALGCAQLSPVAELAAYRAVQEALSNTARHANGAEVTVEAEVTEGGLRVLVRNDPPPGPHPLEPGPGYGLQGMRERVTAAGGTRQCRPHGPRRVRGCRAAAPTG